MSQNPLRENEMLGAVLRLFSEERYDHFTEANLGRKKIDLYCVPKNGRGYYICVELKIHDWKRALWQASRNFQLAERSYIAIWHKYIHRVKKNLELLDEYGVGLIMVEPTQAKIVKESKNKVFRISRRHKMLFYKTLAQQI